MNRNCFAGGQAGLVGGFDEDFVRFVFEVDVLGKKSLQPCTIGFYESRKIRPAPPAVLSIYAVNGKAFRTLW